LDDTSGGTIRVLALIEATSVTGPAKNLIGFARRARPSVELQVATFRRASAPDRGLLPALADAGIGVHLIDEAGAGDVRVLSKLLALLRAERPDIIQTHNTKSHVLLRLAGRARGAPWIAFHHGFTNLDWKDRAYNRLGPRAMRGADRVVTVCRAFAAQLAAAGVEKERILVRPNFVLPFEPPAAAEVESLRARLGMPAGVRVLLAAGRLAPEKGHADLLQAAAILKSGQAGDFRLVIVGEGPERANLERQRRELNLNDVVLLAGYQPDIRPYYGLAGLLVLPSHSEGSPNVLLEAMAAGLPIVATRAGGVAEIAEDQRTALLAPVRDPASLANAIRRLWTDPEAARRLGEEARRTSRQFAPEAYVKALMALYKSLILQGCASARQGERA
jgi:glycosyltransferase involved in cell wall biosynthesis